MCPALLLWAFRKSIHGCKTVQCPVFDFMYRPCDHVQFPGNVTPCTAFKVEAHNDSFLLLIVQQCNIIGQLLLLALQLAQSFNNFLAGLCVDQIRLFLIIQCNI